MYGSFFLNDLLKLLHACFKEFHAKDYDESKDSSENKDDNEMNKDVDYEYGENLEEKLEVFHFYLVKAVAKNRRVRQLNELDEEENC